MPHYQGRNTEQESIDTLFNQRKHYFLSMQNIERACFTALDSSINDAFKVSNDPTIQGWHAGMKVIDILNQLSLIYGLSCQLPPYSKSVCSQR